MCIPGHFKRMRGQAGGIYMYMDILKRAVIDLVKILQEEAPVCRLKFESVMTEYLLTAFEVHGKGP